MLMRISNTRISAFVAAGLLGAWAVSLSGCVTEEKEGASGGSGKGAALYLADGKPAVNAKVRIYPVDHVPQWATSKASASQDLAYSTRTDAEGRYEIESIPRGEYNILAELEGEVAFQDSVFISGAPGEIASDTLRAPGSIKGRVEMEPADNRGTATVQILGTHFIATVDESGAFLLEGMAEGTYRARISTTTPEYNPAFPVISVRSGRVETLETPIRPLYTGIPTVRNVRAVYDTALGQVRVEWSPVAYPNLLEYVVMDNGPGSGFSGNYSIGTTRDTFFVYNVYATGTMIGAVDYWGVGSTREYSVAVRNKSRNLGTIFESAVVGVAPPSVLATKLSFEELGLLGKEASIGDTVTFILSYSNPTRKHIGVQWFITGIGDPVRKAALNAREGRDTLRFRWDEVGKPTVSVAVVDDGHKEWNASTTVYIVQDVPVPLKVISGGGFTGDTLLIHAAEQDKFGRIVKWEWDFGATGTFVRASGPDTFVVVGVQTRYPCVVRVTDDDGNAAVDTFWVNSTEPIRMVSLPSGTFRHSDGRTLGVVAFKMQATEVRARQFLAVMGYEPSFPKIDGGPVQMITLYEAMEFCNKLSRRAGLRPVYDLVNDGFKRASLRGGYRLPTLAEWEYAARAGNEERYWEVRNPDSLDATTWYAANSGNKPHPVGQKKPNGFGLYDMNGNVSEMMDYFDANDGKVGSYVAGMGSNFKTEYFGDAGYLTQFRENWGYLGTKSLTLGFRVVLDE